MSGGLIVPNDLVGWWCPSIDATGGILLDRSGYNNHGTLTNMDPASDWVVNGGKGALDFDGVNDYVSLSNESQLRLRTGCISLWFRVGTQTAPKVMFSSYSQNSSVAGIVIGTNVATGYNDRISCVVGKNTGTGTSDWGHHVVNGKNFSDNQWHHLVVVFTSVPTVLFFVDGNSELAILAFGTAVFPEYADSNFVNIGAEQTGVVIGKYWPGQLDDIRIYNRALTAGEVRQLWQLGRGNMPLKRRRRYTQQASGNRRRRLLTGAEC